MTADSERPSWRLNREPGWQRDIGYSLQDVLTGHRYELGKKGDRPEDPGWNGCSCGWEGYWVDFEPHVADELRKLLVDQQLIER